MKSKKYINIYISVVFVLMLAVMSACGKSVDSDSLSEEAQKICGSWAYNHDKETAVAVFRKDGTAEYEGHDYTFECDSSFISLTDDEGGVLKLRYKLDDEDMYLYSYNTYSYSGEGFPVSLVGVWLCPEKNWSYIFTDKGTFMEDGYFPGHYSVDEASSSFKLMYNDHFEDTVCYYSLEGDKLYIEYPWKMVRTGK